MAEVIWIIDTSSVVEVRRSVENSHKTEVFRRMAILVEIGRLRYPKEVVNELKRAADPKTPDAQCAWAEQNQSKAVDPKPDFEQIKQVLTEVPRVLDPDKDSGEEEADPYVLAMARRLRTEGRDARLVTEERRDNPRKMSLSTAGGLLGIPSVPLKAFLDYEGIVHNSIASVASARPSSSS